MIQQYGVLAASLALFQRSNLIVFPALRARGLPDGTEQIFQKLIRFALAHRCYWPVPHFPAWMSAMMPFMMSKMNLDELGRPSSRSMVAAADPTPLKAT